MNSSTPKTVILLIILGLVVLVVGGFVGAFYQMQKDSPQLNKSAAVFSGVTSKAVPSIIAYGQVSNIQGRDVTLTFSGDSITVGIAANANIYSFDSQITPNASGNAGRKPLGFSDLKKGDTLNISMNVSPEGQFVGNAVMVLPASH